MDPEVRARWLARLSKSATDWLSLPDKSIGLVTNWATSYVDDMALPGCKQRLHLPVFECKPELGMGSLSQIGVILVSQIGVVLVSQIGVILVSQNGAILVSEFGVKLGSAFAGV